MRGRLGLMMIVGLCYVGFWGFLGEGGVMGDEYVVVFFFVLGWSEGF